MSNHSLPARGTDPPFSNKSVVSVMHEQNVICSKTIICRQLFAGHVVSSRPMKSMEKIHPLIIILIMQLHFVEYKYHSVFVLQRNGWTGFLATRKRRIGLKLRKQFLFVKTNFLSTFFLTEMLKRKT